MAVRPARVRKTQQEGFPALHPFRVLAVRQNLPYLSAHEIHPPFWKFLVPKSYHAGPANASSGAPGCEEAPREFRGAPGFKTPVIR